MRRDRGITVAELGTRLRARFPDLDVLSGDREPTYVELESAVSWTSTGNHTSYLPYAAHVPA